MRTSIKVSLYSRVLYQQGLSEADIIIIKEKYHFQLQHRTLFFKAPYHKFTEVPAFMIIET